MERIDTLRVILKEMWVNYHIENNPSKKVQILEKIEGNQVYLSSYMIQRDMYYNKQQTRKIKSQPRIEENKILSFSQY